MVQHLFLSFLALVAGTRFVIQQAVNANLCHELGSARWAGFVSYLGGTIVMLVMVLAMRAPLLSFQVIARSSWWSWWGGLFGAVCIAISILLLPRPGAFTVEALIVIGQLVTPPRLRPLRHPERAALPDYRIRKQSTKGPKMVFDLRPDWGEGIKEEVRTKWACQ
jgi:transporter family-2 protein